MSQLSSALGDADTFREIFFEETQEHLANVEAILLRLDTDAPLPDDLNAIFRAVHSIKGSAGMLGCTDMAALTHLQENLLDLLRKGERPIGKGDIDAMLKAGDTVRSQVLHHRGLLSAAPDSSQVEAMMLERVRLPSTDAPGMQAGQLVRNFTVRLAPLAEPIDDAELDMMLQGLGEMGVVENTVVDNVAGGSVRFDVSLQGAAADLQSVLSLVVAPDQISIETRSDGAPDPVAEAAAVLAQAAAVVDGDEFFVDPAQFKRRGHAADPSLSAAPKAAAQPTSAHAATPVDLFVTPEQLKAQRAPVAVREPAEPADHHEAPSPAADSLRRGADQQAHAGGSDAFIRVATEKVDLLVNLVGELVITEAMLARHGALAETGAASHYGGNTGLADLSRHTRNLQEAVLAIRMLPISNVFSRFPRLVRELALRLGKRVEVRMSGEGTELDRGLIEKISDPLTHLVRNAVDHGLESPEARIAAGKPPVGVVNLRASQRGGNIVIEVSDDGRGLDVERIRARAAERGMAVPADAPDEEVWALIFEAGFSTAEEVTDVSGRGVGMDVVKRNIQSLNGTIDLFSTPGQGTRVTVSVPLTLAIMEAMTVSVGGEIYVLPLACVAESRSVDPADLHTLPGQGDTLRVRDDYLPVLQLARLFPPRVPSAQGGGIAVIVETDGCDAALLVDELVGQQQVVVKSLETNFRKVPGLSGATVMGDGSVALILDVGHLVRLAGREGALLL
ncbi:chemotaxis protein CheA [Caenimonas terrae]|uniref:Chemotaxis protein CheA n=1 Tax=Caenimonas terrae TaxID=696074 RepID=A0ABW0NEX9_9BURK